MQIDETVTNGRVHIGVLSSSDDSGGETGIRGTDLAMDAWSNPAIEIEEQYIGTYHIAENFTINNGYGQKNRPDDWLNCCGVGYIISPLQPVSISADYVFNCIR
jgi:hypothetical protein